MTDDDIEKIKKAMENELTPLQLSEMTRILQKFKRGTTAKDHFEGMVTHFYTYNFYNIRFIEKSRKNLRDSFSMTQNSIENKIP